MSIADKLTTIAENEPKVYEAGKDAEHNAFWDSFVTNGILSYAAYLFAGNGWSSRTFLPNKNLIFTGSANGLFRESNIGNLKACLDSCGVTLDFSRATSLNNAFAYSSFKYLPKISMLSAKSNTQSTFGGTSSSGSPLIWIDEVEVAETSTFNKSFDYCKNLEHVIFTGTLATNGLNLQWSTLLDKESLLSLLNCLKDYSQDTSGTDWYITIGAENIAKLTEEEKLIAINKGWDIR